MLPLLGLLYVLVPYYNQVGLEKMWEELHCILCAKNLSFR